MKDDAIDELLQDMSEFDQAEEQEMTLENVEAPADKPKNTASESQKRANEETANSVNLALEAAKTAQEAASRSQDAAETTLKLAEQLKSQERILVEANFNWRQTLRNATSNFNKIKGQVVLMLATALVVSLVSVGILSFLLFAVQQQHQDFKDEILDMLHTERGMMDKTITIKMDEIAAMVEQVSYEVSEKPQGSHSHDMTDPDLKTPSDAVNHTDETADETVNETPIENTNHAEQHPVEPEQHLAIATKMETETVHVAEKVGLSKEDLSILKSQNDQLMARLEKIEHAQAEMLKKFNAQKPTVVTTSNSKGLSPTQEQQLKNIHWWASKQDKTIARIEQELKKQQQMFSTASTTEAPSFAKEFSTIDKQMKLMRTQQSLIEAQLTKLQGNVEQLIKKSNESYRYQAKDSQPIYQP